MRLRYGIFGILFVIISVIALGVLYEMDVIKIDSKLLSILFVVFAPIIAKIKEWLTLPDIPPPKTYEEAKNQREKAIEAHQKEIDKYNREIQAIKKAEEEKKKHVKDADLSDKAALGKELLNSQV